MRAKGPAEAIEIRRGEIERLRGAGSQYYKVTGEIQVNGTGEGAITVPFPIFFVGKPALSIGHELGPGQPYTSGNFPVCSTTVLRWEEKIRDDGTVLYAGALFGIVTSGPVGQVVIVQWHVEGIGIRNPIPAE